MRRNLRRNFQKRVVGQNGDTRNALMRAFWIVVRAVRDWLARWRGCGSVLHLAAKD